MSYTFNIPPQHKLAVVAVIAVKEMIAAKHQYATITGVTLPDGRQIFQIVAPAKRTECMAVGLRRWLKTYQNHKRKVKNDY
ncbi:hypothetical protein [Vitreoscilla stercoraria]|uniref:Uncharacterized protein n=1 Tax=Vitreoscilla stercoraria TaxID=61 RepID=A0ABY4EDD7_VITST|nr:hypothetical protein [Vitreoscilla stercoraria]UOO93358.1 hypothetical protein LVJ81_04845 [Vitreoscilla stercoraria]